MVLRGAANVQMMVQKGSVLVVCAWCAWCVGFIFQKSKHLKSALVYQTNGCVFVFSPLNRTHHAHPARLANGIKKGPRWKPLGFI
jgi:hypothetical protein